MSMTVIRGDATQLPLADDSVDMVVTSPPYFGLRSYEDGGEHCTDQVGAEGGPHDYIDALIAVTREMVRVTKPTGSIWVNLGDKFSGAQQQNSGRQSGTSSSDYWKRTNPKVTGIPNKSLMGLPWRYALRCIDELGLALRAEVIWGKPNGLPEPVRDRVRRSHEQWFHFTMQDRYFSNIDAIREPHVRQWGGSANGGHTYSAMKAPGAKDSNLATSLPNPKGKVPGSVRIVATEPLKVPEHLAVQHFAAFPSAWPAWIIPGWCPDAGTVLDPFGGTGTTAHVADALGRHGISVDLSLDYCRVAAYAGDDSPMVRRQRKVTA